MKAVRTNGKDPRLNVYRLTRIARDMTASEIAEKLGVTRGYVYAIEKGDREPSLSAMARYAEAVRVDVNTMFMLRETCLSADGFQPAMIAVLSELIRQDEQNTALSHGR